jgi:hypothetical protein
MSAKPVAAKPVLDNTVFGGLGLMARGTLQGQIHRGGWQEPEEAGGVIPVPEKDPIPFLIGSATCLFCLQPLPSCLNFAKQRVICLQP